VNIFDMATNGRLHGSLRSRASVVAMTYVPEETVLVTAHTDLVLRTWNLDEGPLSSRCVWMQSTPVTGIIVVVASGAVVVVVVVVLAVVVVVLPPSSRHQVSRHHVVIVVVFITPLLLLLLLLLITIFIITKTLLLLLSPVAYAPQVEATIKLAHAIRAAVPLMGAQAQAALRGHHRRRGTLSKKGHTPGLKHSKSCEHHHHLLSLVSPPVPTPPHCYHSVCFPSDL
jgi:hypothetical protein